MFKLILALSDITSCSPGRLSCQRNRRDLYLEKYQCLGKYSQRSLVCGSLELCAASQQLGRPGWMQCFRCCCPLRRVTSCGHIIEVLTSSGVFCCFSHSGCKRTTTPHF